MEDEEQRARWSEITGRPIEEAFCRGCRNEGGAIADNWGKSVPDEAPERIDYTGNGSIGIGDWSAYTDNYGETDGSANDPLVTHAALDSSGGNTVGAWRMLVGTCDFGHQGLLFDREFGLYYNRARYLHPVLGQVHERAH